GTGVQIALTYTGSNGGDFAMSSQSTVSVTGAAAYNHIVIWSASTKGTDAVKLVGTSGTSITGTVYVPHGDLSIAGGSSSVVTGQVWGSTVKLTGGGAAAVVYDANRSPALIGPLLVE